MDENLFQIATDQNDQKANQERLQKHTTGN